MQNNSGAIDPYIQTNDGQILSLQDGGGGGGGEGAWAV